MRRRDLLSVPVLSPGLTAAGSSSDTGGTAGGGRLNISGLGLPVIAGGRLRNYVFISLRLHLGSAATPESVRSREPFLRDALVRAAHRTPFLVDGDWTRLDAAAISASVMRSAASLVGRGAVTRVEVVSQAPRRRTGVRPA
jgi:hypothetical protein